MSTTDFEKETISENLPFYTLKLASCTFANIQRKKSLLLYRDLWPCHTSGHRADKSPVWSRAEWVHRRLAWPKITPHVNPSFATFQLCDPRTRRGWPSWGMAASHFLCHINKWSHNLSTCSWGFCYPVQLTYPNWCIFPERGCSEFY